MASRTATPSGVGGVKVNDPKVCAAAKRISSTAAMRYSRLAVMVAPVANEFSGHYFGDNAHDRTDSCRAITTTGYTDGADRIGKKKIILMTRAHLCNHCL